MCVGGIGTYNARTRALQTVSEYLLDRKKKIKIIIIIIIITIIKREEVALFFQTRLCALHTYNITLCDVYNTIMYILNSVCCEAFYII